MNTIEIREMSVTERLQIMEAIWDSLLYDEFSIESPEWHRDVLGERKRRIKNGEAEFVSLDALKGHKP